MDHLAQDLSVALEETESCGPITLDNNRKWGIRRRTRSAGNLRKNYPLLVLQLLFSFACNVLIDIYTNKSGDNQSEDSSSSISEIRIQDRNRAKYATSFHHSDSDDMSLSLTVARAINTRSHSLRMKNSIQAFIRTRYSKIGNSRHNSVYALIFT